MSLIKKLKYLKNTTRIGTFILPRIRKVFDFLAIRLVSDKKYIEYKFYFHQGYRLNLKNPRTFNEKINFLKLYDRTPLHTKSADKYEVRNYIADKIGADYLVPLFFQTKDVNEIHSDNLPDIPCIIKTNHDSGGGIFIRNKNEVDYKFIREQLHNRMLKNYYSKSKEWQYKNIQPRIIVEKLLLDNHGKAPMDYKLHCINGNVRMINVDKGRGTKSHTRNWYNKYWVREPYSWSSPKENGKFTLPSNHEVPKPKTLNQMIKLSEILSQEFDYVRIDWYELDEKLYFGELTFHHDGGYQPILPKKWDQKLGDLLELKLAD